MSHPFNSIKVINTLKIFCLMVYIDGMKIIHSDKK